MATEIDNITGSVSTTTGTGPIVVGAALKYHRSIPSVLADNAQRTFMCIDKAGTDFMLFVGTYHTTGTNITIDTVKHSSNGGTGLVNWTGGKLEVSVVASREETLTQLLEGFGIKITANDTQSTIALKAKEYFDRTKPAGEPIWIAGIGQSLWQPMPTSAPAAYNANIWDYGSDGAGGNYMFRQLDITATAKVDVVQPYTGHSLGTSTSVSHGIAYSLQEWTGRSVYITNTWWNGHGLVNYFYPFADPGVNAEYGDGYNEFRLRMKAASTAILAVGGKAVPDYIFYDAGQTDSSTPNTQWAEYLYQTDRQFELDNIINKTTVRVFTDMIEEQPAHYLNINFRAAAEILRNNSRHAIVIPFLGKTFDSTHFWGNDLFNTGREAAHLLMDSARNYPATVGQRFVRSQRTAIGYLRYKAITDTVPTLGDFTFNTNTGATILRMPRLTRTLPWTISQTASTPSLYQELYKPGFRIKMTDVVTPANNATYAIQEGTPVWGGSLPAAAGVQNHIGLPVIATTTGGTWPPPVDTDITWKLETNNVYGTWSTANVGTLETAYDNGGLTFTTPIKLSKSTSVTPATAAHGGTLASSTAGRYVLVDNLGAEVAGILPASGRLECMQTTTGMPDGWNASVVLTINEATTGFLSGIIRVAGRRTDVTANNSVYAAEMPFVSNIVGTDITNVNHIINYGGTVYGIVNPSSKTFTQQLRIGGSQGFFGRNTHFRVPDILVETWQWSIIIDFQFRKY